MTLKQMLRRMCAERPKDYDKYLSALLFAIREVPQESLWLSPFESRKENPQNLTQLSSRSHPRHLVGKKDSRKRHHHRHHKRQPGEQQFPKQVVTG